MAGGLSRRGRAAVGLARAVTSKEELVGAVALSESGLSARGRSDAATVANRLARWRQAAGAGSAWDWASPLQKERASRGDEAVANGRRRGGCRDAAAEDSRRARRSEQG
jgi:hypothetical protein